MNDKIDVAGGRRWLLWLALIWAAGAAWLIFSKWAQIKGLGLPDTDDNMRLQQVRDWLAGQGWFDLRQHRMLPPLGADIHWSRLVDLPLAGLILFFKLFASTGFAERAAIAIAPVLPLFVAMLAAALIGRRLVGAHAWAVGPVFAMFAPMMLAMMTPGRIDHHGWQLALLMLMVFGMVMRRPALGGAISGVALGLSLAIGIELLPYLGLTTCLIALFWVADRGEARRVAAFGAAAAASTTLSLLLFVPPSVRMIGYCDALSIAHVEALAIGGAGLVLLAAIGFRNPAARLASVIGLGLAVAAFIWLRHPQCLGDPSALIDADARRLWLANVREARPIYRQSIPVIAGTLSLPLFGLVGVGLAMWRSRTTPDLLMRWAAIGLLGAFSFGFCFFQTRAGPAAQALAIPGVTMLGWSIVQIAERLRPVPRTIALIAAFYLVSGVAVQVVVEKLPAAKQNLTVRRAAGANRSCASLRALAPLDAVPAATMFTLLDLSPRLIVGTHHSAITGPYHRNGHAIADVMKAFGGTAGEARAIIGRYHAGYVLICPGTSESTIYVRRAPTGFYAMLAKGQAPAWLEPVPLAMTTPYKLWRVRNFP